MENHIVFVNSGGPLVAPSTIEGWLNDGYEVKNITADNVGIVLLFTKLTEEEKRAAEAKLVRPAPAVEIPAIIKTLEKAFAVDVKQFKPGGFGAALDPKDGMTWVSTDKWKDSVEWTLLPNDVAETIKKLAKSLIPAENVPGNRDPAPNPPVALPSTQ